MLNSLRVRSSSTLAARLPAILLPLMLSLPLASQAASSSEESCRVCHRMDSKLIGPAFKDVAARYAADPEAIAHLKHSMLEGSQGRWGEMAMPPNTGLTEAEADSFAHWIMSLNKPVAGGAAVSK
ncbi:cytochrome c [Herbaspirillum sp. Sphag1AN]|uniref:c-type cytochrome n=1 Tax=unclassified Herbaspirillum TaxID=2624150 RepID=UPI0017E52BB1|nr:MULTISPECIES: c-type cytochrome [unclassified Herbaspirillum]MBB3214161.1 cytochrome c [Herbaspirillum sp. Sphag1AN]MBB3247287.1 cytochrome c [Herbaspirillum sp. Sphag64]